jgi:hypothetical protein
MPTLHRELPASPESKNGAQGRLFLTAFLLCLLQIAFTWVFSPRDQVSSAAYLRVQLPQNWNTAPRSYPALTGYFRFNNWDSLRFFEISQYGYHIPDQTLELEDIHSYRANVTTPPAYPWIVRMLTKSFTLSGELALLLAAQLGCWISWTYYLLLLRQAGIPKRWRLGSALTVVFHPAAFYMVVGYSESLFVASLLGFIFWTDRWSRSGFTLFWLGAACHGALGTATRLAAFPLVVYPLGKAVEVKFKNADGERLPTPMLSAALALAASFGLLFFFTFCFWKFGEWNLYFRISKMVAQEADYLAILDPRSYLPRFFFEDTMWSINRSAVPWTLALFIWSFRWDLDWRKRFGIYSTAAALFYMAVAGKATTGMDGMIRYTFPVFVLLVLNLTQVLFERRWTFQSIPVLNRILIGCGYLLSFTTQGWIAWRFLHGRWVS